MTKYWVTWIDGNPCVVTGAPIPSRIVYKCYYESTAEQLAQIWNMQDDCAVTSTALRIPDPSGSRLSTVRYG